MAEVHRASIFPPSGAGEAQDQPLIHRRLWRFTPAMIEDVPDLPGVYALWYDGELVYYGCASTFAGYGIGFCLKQHLAEHQAGRGRLPTHYSWEITHRPQARHVELLNRFWRVFRRFPRGNEAVRPRVVVLGKE